MFLTLLFFFNVLHVFLFVVIYHSSLTKLSINIHPTHSIITTWLCFVLRCEKKKATKPKTRYGSSPGVKGETTMSVLRLRNCWDLNMLGTMTGITENLHRCYALLVLSDYCMQALGIVCSPKLCALQHEKSYIKLASSFNIGKHSLL